jgi:hypothetical protein
MHAPNANAVRSRRTTSGRDRECSAENLFHLAQRLCR